MSHLSIKPFPKRKYLENIRKNNSLTSVRKFGNDIVDP
jgi:hypothetical protein